MVGLIRIIQKNGWFNKDYPIKNGWLESHILKVWSIYLHLGSLGDKCRDVM